MKVGFFRTDFYGDSQFAGSFSHVKGFLEGLKKLGHEYFVISSGDLPLDSSRVLTVPYSTFFRNWPAIPSIAYNNKLIPIAKKIIQRENPDFLYHRHSEFNYSSTILARKFSLPLVLECNGSEVWIKKHWGRVRLEKILRLAETVQFLGADIITVVSEVMKHDLIHLGVDAGKILVNPNGVDPDQFHPTVDGSIIRRQYGLEEKLVAGFVGTFGAWHGVEVMARAILPTVEKNKKVHFFMIGNGPLRGEVERIIRESGVSEFVTLIGSTPHSEIPKYLAACDILLSPHVHNPDGTQFFGSPTKLFEYMAMAKPIIASGVGQIGDVISDGQNGLLMKERDHNDLAEKILKLSDDNALRDRLGAAARNNAVQKYSWQQNAQRVIDAVQPFLNR